MAHTPDSLSRYTAHHLTSEALLCRYGAAVRLARASHGEAYIYALSNVHMFAAEIAERCVREEGDDAFIEAGKVNT